jgi:hypothetical protein
MTILVFISGILFFRIWQFTEIYASDGFSFLGADRRICYFCHSMSVQGLPDVYKNSPRLFQLADRLSIAQPQKIHLKNLYGSASQFVVAAILQHPSCVQLNHLIVLNDAEDAA